MEKKHFKRKKSQDLKDELNSLLYNFRTKINEINKIENESYYNKFSELQKNKLSIIKKVLTLDYNKIENRINSLSVLNNKIEQNEIISEEETNICLKEIGRYLTDISDFTTILTNKIYEINQLLKEVNNGR